MLNVWFELFGFINMSNHPVDVNSITAGSKVWPGVTVYIKAQNNIQNELLY